MRVSELITVLSKLDPEGEIRLGASEFVQIVRMNGAEGRPHYDLQPLGGGGLAWGRDRPGYQGSDQP